MAPPSNTLAPVKRPRASRSMVTASTGATRTPSAEEVSSVVKSRGQSRQGMSRGRWRRMVRRIEAARVPAEHAAQARPPQPPPRPRCRWYSAGDGASCRRRALRGRASQPDTVFPPTRRGRTRAAGAATPGSARPVARAAEPPRGLRSPPARAPRTAGAARAAWPAGRTVRAIRIVGVGARCSTRKRTPTVAPKKNSDRVPKR